MKNLLQTLIQRTALASAILALATTAFAENYTIDASHTTIGFSVKHLMVSKTTGEFTDYQGTIAFEPANPAATMIDVVIQATSIDTENGQRDGHLRTADFFDVENNPTITFKSKRISQQGSQYQVIGDLTIRGVTKEITLPLNIQGPVNSPFGSKVIGLSGQTTINRQDFGISWNKTMDQGGFVVGDEVTIQVNVEAHAQG